MSRLEADKVLGFVTMLHALQRVTRVMHVPGEDRYENDVEHSYLLAMAVWHAIDAFGLPLDRDKAIRYALAHDMVEVYAGDTYVYTQEPGALEGKKDREKAAREKLAQDFPDVPAIHEAMEAYEHQTDAESVFVRAFDKIMPVIANYIQDGRTLKEHGVSYSQLVDLKRRTTKSSPEVADLLEQLIALIDTDRSRFFGKFVD